MVVFVFFFLGKRKTGSSDNANGGGIFSSDDTNSVGEWIITSLEFREGFEDCRNEGRGGDIGDLSGLLEKTIGTGVGRACRGL